MILHPLTPALPPLSRVFTLRTGLSCVHICPFDVFLRNPPPSRLFYPRPSLTPRCQSRPWRPTLVRDLPGGLAEIHGAACPNVDAKCINVRSKVTIKGKSALARAGVMGWRGHGDALSPSQILKQTGQIRILSVFWMFEMQNCKHGARELCCSCGRFFFAL